MRSWIIVPLLLGASALVLSACGPIHSITLGRGGHGDVHHGHHGHGPPAHAPAHGHRRKWAQHRHQSHHHQRTRSVEMVFDGDLGVYVVVDMPDHYYWDGWYLRIQDGGWYASADLHGSRWEPRVPGKLPPGLARKHHGKSHKHKHRGRSKGHRGKHKGPAKPGW